MTSTPEFIQVRTEGRVGIVTLYRPKQLNALNDQLIDELGAALKAFDADAAIGCMIVTGSEKAFAAGADIGAMASYSFADVYKGDYITRNWETIRQIRKPVIAAVEGAAAGAGLSMALACDMLVAAKNSVFSVAYVKVGLTPDGGATAFLAEFVSRQLLTELCLTGERISGERLHALGPVNRLAEPGEALTQALALAAQVATGPDLAMGRIKALWIMGTNPVVSMPDADGVRAAIGACTKPCSVPGSASTCEAPAALGTATRT